MADLGYTSPGEPDVSTATSSAGPTCAWIKGGKSTAVGILTGNRDRGAGGLATIYHNKQTGHFAFVEPAPEVEGYPAVYADVQDQRSSGKCVMYVGIADDLTFTVKSGGYEGGQDSCDAAQKVSAAVVKTLKGA